ncbi:MAG: TonB-dependent receptor, partial [Pedobacter sp.]
YYPYQSTYTQGSYSGINTIIATYPGNPDLKWEKTFVANVGVDFELFNRRLYGDVNVYDKRTKDLFVRKNLSLTSGFTALNINGGELSNKGVEVTLNYDIVRNNKVTWTVFGNFGYNKNNVEDLGGETSFEQGTELIKIGKPLGTHYEVRYGGVDAATGRPLYYTADGVLTTVYNASNRVQEFGTWEAPWKGGFGTSVKFGGFELSTLFSFQEGATKVDNLEFFLENPSFLAQGYNQSASLRQWQKPGDVASTGSPLYPFNFSSNLIHDASFVRLRDVTLSFAFPRSLISKSKLVTNAKFYVQGTNLFMWTHWRGRDPEAGATNINISEYPNPRAVTAGLNITF